ncbi:MAG TPA: zinc-dependent metalloprotease family protein [Thermoanaerobaculia bacterium]|nr:zinc-dependent metalloprotease family protein [Thermoanaerobaculia bacterium]
MVERRVAALCFALATLPASAADEVFFRDMAPEALPERGGDWEIPLPRHFRVLEVDVSALEGLLGRAPAERSAAAEAAPLLFAIPYPDGTNRLFRVEESPILDPDLAARFPEIHTFSAKGIDDPTATARLSLTSLGFHAMVLSASGTVFVAPYRRWDSRYVLSYYKKDGIRSGRKGEEPFHCETGGVSPEEERTWEAAPAGPVTAAAGTQLRTYRLAVAATGEYSTAVCAPSPAAVACAMNAIAVSVNRVVGIYEREVAIRMVLVANNDLVVYTNGATDPYSNSNGGTMLGQNQTNLNIVIGSANYDVGHVFSTGGGGVAQFAVPCTANKARGVTGSSSPVGDGFDVDYVAHEMGHQFGAAHTFNGTTGNCGGNRSSSSAYEPGSGTTIMAYAGICGAEDLQPHSDDTFHTRSFDQIVTFSTGATGSSCAAITSTGNTPPTVNAGPAYTIPRQTPFTLTGSATDPDPDTLTYMWEEFDLGAASPPNTDVTAVRPIFRSFVPLSVPSRTFPRLSDILGNVTTLGESMSTRNRTMTFRLTVRDNRVGGGGVDYASTTVTVNAAAGPFQVTQPNTAVSWVGDNAQTVTWDVAGTSGAPVSCASVDIHLSTDGGNTFSTVLAASTANDGSAMVTLPNTPTTQARIRISCVGNVFFDVSNVNFTITENTEPPPVATDFFTVTPCRIVDTRDPIGLTGGPALIGGTIRTFPIAGNCGVPPDAVAVAVNVTAIQSTAPGSLEIFPAGITPPLVSTISFGAGQVRANNAILGLDGTTPGSLDVRTDLNPAGLVHFTLDVTGYFK